MSDVTAPPTLQSDADAAALIDFVRDREVPCPLCGYNLRALTRPMCPECGRELRLSVGLVEPRQGAWLVAQIALAGAGTIGLLALVSIVRNGWPRGSDNQWLMDVSFCYWLACIPLATGMFFLRRRYLRWGRAVQWWIAGVSAGFTAFSVLSLYWTG